MDGTIGTIVVAVVGAAGVYFNSRANAKAQDKRDQIAALALAASKDREATLQLQLAQMAHDAAITAKQIEADGRRDEADINGEHSSLPAWLQRIHTIEKNCQERIGSLEERVEELLAVIRAMNDTRAAEKSADARMWMAAESARAQLQADYDALLLERNQLRERIAEMQRRTKPDTRGD
jgi:spore cortex formation protein SpoVR/YcgB (stage V sporulation)